MNVKTLIAVATLLTSAGTVFAGNVDPFVEHTDFASTRNRAEVIAEMQQAAAKGGLARTPEFVDHSNVVSTRTRGAVRNEETQAAKSRPFNSYAGH